jgi:hypothetical protein
MVMATKEGSETWRNSAVSSTSEITHPRASFKRTFKGRSILCAFWLVAVIGLFKLLSYRSSEPWIFGLYSLPYFVFLVGLIGATLFLTFLFYRFRLKALYILVGSAILFVISIAAIELGGQVYAFLYPSYRVLSLIPDRMVGWKLAPNLRFTWAGHYWYAREFSAPIETNSQGFRDIQRTFAKPQVVIRVALLGDSMVEAMHVPFDKTAGHLLEQRLNAFAKSEAVKPPKYEVLNFGVSNYGVGQYLLAWEEYASKFIPDYVYIFVAEIQLDRTVTKYEPSTLSNTPTRLRVRPTFRLKAGELVREPARDFDEFVNAQNELIRKELGGKRVVRRTHGLFIGPLLNVSLWQRLVQVQKRLSADVKNSQVQAQMISFHPVDQEMIDVNLRVIEELGRRIKQRGSRLIVVDASGYFLYLRWERLPATLRQFCAEKGFGWIPLANELLKAEKNGILTRWPYDQHFNETGNEMFAEAMYRWMAHEVEDSKNYPALTKADMTN